MQEHGLLRTHEVANAIGISRKYVSKLLNERADFPHPVRQDKRSYLWAADAPQLIQAWMAANITRDSRPGPPIERFLRKVRWADCHSYTHDNGSVTPCLEFTSGRDKNDYGHFWDGEMMTTAHRFFYEWMFGPIPKRDAAGNRLDLDHLCRWQPCCWPGHFEVVPVRVNTVERGMNPSNIAHRNDRCLRDLHDLTGDNLLVNATNGRRKCKACELAKTSERRQAAKAAIATGTYTGSHGRFAYGCGCKCAICSAAERDHNRRRGQTSSA